MDEKTVSLSLRTILRECLLNTSLAWDYFHDFGMVNRDNFHDVFRYRKFSDDCVDYVDCFNDGNHPVGMIRPSYDEFLRKLIALLNLSIEGSIEDNEELTKRLLQRVDRLREITTEPELRKEFPLLYKDLIDGRKYYDGLQKLKAIEGYDKEHYTSGEHYYYSCGLKKSLSNFIETQSEVYSRFVLRRKDFQKKIQQTSFNKYFARRIDMDKFYLYVIHEYLNMAEKIKNQTIIKKYVEYIEKCLHACKNKNVSITTDSGQKVTFSSVIERLKSLKTFLEDQCFQVEWVIIPEGKDLSKVRKNSGQSRVTLMNCNQIQRLHEIGSKREDYYEKTPCIGKAVGLNRYRGYIARFYENGLVVLDRKYNPDAPSTAKGNALFYLNIYNFIELSQYEKKRLRKDPRVGVIYHSATWEDRVTKLIQRPATDEEKECSYQFIKKLQKNGSC